MASLWYAVSLGTSGEIQAEVNRMIWKLYCLILIREGYIGKIIVPKRRMQELYDEAHRINKDIDYELADYRPEDEG